MRAGYTVASVELARESGEKFRLPDKDDNNRSAHRGGRRAAVRSELAAAKSHTAAGQTVRGRSNNVPNDECDRLNS